MSLITSIAIFVVSLTVGAAGIYAGVRLVADSSVSFVSALITALLGVIVYTVLGFLNIIPLLGPLLLLIIWVGVINFRYPGGWIAAGGIGLVAWFVSVAVLYLLGSIFEFISLSALGVPGV
ncbi:hypothetical protein [Halococcus sp. AFM35]|jgi:hypothetical protein|uniref:hypothetical protein n=1 Tax=Halococcus sp. AFM35 TaxID=3421653 RepID=UPI003EBD1F38